MAGLCEGGNEPLGSRKTICTSMVNKKQEKIVKRAEKPSVWLSRLRRFPAGLKLRLGAGWIPAWADYLVGFFSEVFPNRKDARINTVFKHFLAPSGECVADMPFLLPSKFFNNFQRPDHTRGGLAVYTLPALPAAEAWKANNHNSARARWSWNNLESVKVRSCEAVTCHNRSKFCPDRTWMFGDANVMRFALRGGQASNRLHFTGVYRRKMKKKHEFHTAKVTEQHRIHFDSPSKMSKPLGRALKKLILAEILLKAWNPDTVWERTLILQVDEDMRHALNMPME
ncbi:hypothetical protein ANN_18420 [Periplaneta americana]|uniref:Uncharacterized protein n=1 Tax=Periplaneta americana TaxID=6978 RepID=A0ABQ8SPY2_PERAM|nr:hypothetical protein ANN_18420 [Periplaneta americana]